MGVDRGEIGRPMTKQEMMVLRWQSIGLIAAILMLAACEGTEQRMEEASRATGVGDTTAAETPPAAEVREARAMPSSIERAMELSEEIHSDLEDNDWDAAAEKTRELQSLSGSLRQTDAPTADVTRFDSAVGTLAEGVASRGKVAAGLAASEVHRAAVSMAAAYSPEVPAAVGNMESATWDLVYHSEAGDWAKAEEVLGTLEGHYSRVRAHVAQRDQELARKVDTELEALRRAVVGKDLNAVREAADKVEDEIDDIEDTYKDRRGRDAAPGDTMRHDATQGDTTPGRQ